MTNTSPLQIGIDGVPRGQAVLDELIRLLDLEQLETNLFRGVSPPDRTTRVFGGQVAGQAMVAAGRTVSVDRSVHSLHSYFVRPGDPRIPIVFQVERVRDGRSFTTRRVLAIQRGEPIFQLSASFQLPQQGLDHSIPPPSGVPDPESLPDLAERAVNGQGAGYLANIARPIDVRFVDDPVWTPERDPTDQPVRFWMRADGILPDDPLLHVCMLTYASDMTLLPSALARHDVDLDSVQMASLDHAMWFHRPFRMDDWLLYTCWSPTASGGRALVTGQFTTRDGRLVASTTQEGLARILR